MTEESKQILYKFRDWSSINHKLLTEREIYIASPKDFNDPFDCRITYNFDLLDTDEKIKEYISAFNRRKKGIKNPQTTNIDEFMFNDIKNNKDEFQKEWNENLFKLQDRDYGVLSLSEVWDSILMWGHYSANHTGFCVGLYADQLKEEQIFGKGGPVQYSEIFPQMNPSVDNTPEIGYIATHTKAIDWSYEKEYRFFKLFHEKPPDTKDRIAKLKETSFAEVNIGVNFPNDELNNIKSAVTSLNLPLYQVKQIQSEFKLSRVRLL